MRHVVMFSGGIGSWAAAKRVVERHGAADLTLLFADTLMEDEDLYRFLDEAAANVFRNMPPNLVRVAEGRTPWQVFFDKRFLGNSRVDPCSDLLKRRMADSWLAENCDPAETVVHVGIDWTEDHRFFGRGDKLGLQRRRAADGWRYEAPMCEAPWMTKRDMLAWLKAEGIRPPRLYEMGFAHNNCGGFCIKAGQGHFATLLREMPERYAEHEAKEEAIRSLLGKDVSMMTDRETVRLTVPEQYVDDDGETQLRWSKVVKKPLTMRQLRERIQAGGQVDLFEIGGCGCFLDEAAPLTDNT